jgi:hypothetical protein
METAKRAKYTKGAWPLFPLPAFPILDFDLVILVCQCFRISAFDLIWI